MIIFKTTTNNNEDGDIQGRPTLLFWAS